MPNPHLCLSQAPISAQTQRKLYDSEKADVVHYLTLMLSVQIRSSTSHVLFTLSSVKIGPKGGGGGVRWL